MAFSSITAGSAGSAGSKGITRCQPREPVMLRMRGIGHGLQKAREAQDAAGASGSRAARTIEVVG
ncbi:hypothetical protein [Azorhizobium doebereinerae]|uniref:hypothetical protein n=1 Tax=Azorhizobium doebereinerae TaxID=281091 RepID=UPI0012EBC992|nr:hypothetical protein [Azorhizobium doebereinerae]